MSDYAELVKRLRGHLDINEDHAAGLLQIHHRASIKNAADAIEAQAKRIAELEAALGRVLDDVTFMIERQMIPDVRADVIYVRALAALGKDRADV